MNELEILVNVIPVPWLSTVFGICKTIYLTTNKFYDNKKILMNMIDRVYSLLVVINNNEKKYKNKDILLYIKRLEDILNEICKYTTKIQKRHNILNILLSNDIRDNLSSYNDDLNAVINDLQLTYSININNTLEIQSSHIESMEYIKNMLEQNDTHEKIVSDMNLDYKTAYQLMQYLEKKIKNKDFNSDLKMTIANKILKAYKVTSGELVSVYPWTLTNFEINIDDVPFNKGYDGEIYRGTWLKSTKVAIKRINLDKLKTEDFINIVNIWYNMRHEYLIPLYGASYCNEYGYYVMPYIENGSVIKYLDNVKWDAFEINRIIYEISVGMYYMHTRSYCHGDLKLNNILIDDNKHVKIIDFDLVLNNDRNNIRSVRWCPPEIFDKDILEINKFKHDVYSFGFLCYEIFTQGRIPFDVINEKDLIKQILTFEKFNIYDFSIKIDNLLLDIINKCVIKDYNIRLDFENIVDNLRKIVNCSHTSNSYTYRTTSITKSNRKILYSDNIYSIVHPYEKITHNYFGNVLYKYLKRTKSCVNNIKEFEFSVSNSIVSIVFIDTTMYFASGKIIYSYNFSNKCIKELNGHTDWVIKLYIYNNTLYSMSTDNTIRSWSDNECSNIIYLPSNSYSTSCVFIDNCIYIGLYNSKIMEYNINTTILRCVFEYVSPIIYMTNNKNIIYCVYQNSVIKVFDTSISPILCIQTMNLLKSLSKIIITSSDIFVMVNGGTNITKYKIMKNYKIKYKKTIYRGIYGYIVDFVYDENKKILYMITEKDHVIKYDLLEKITLYDIYIKDKKCIACASYNNLLCVSGHDKKIHIIE